MSVEEAARAVRKLVHFGLHHQRDELMNIMLEAESHIQQIKFDATHKKQTSIQDFFRPAAKQPRPSTD